MCKYQDQKMFLIFVSYHVTKQVSIFIYESQKGVHGWQTNNFDNLIMTKICIFPRKTQFINVIKQFLNIFVKILRAFSCILTENLLCENIWFFSDFRQCWYSSSASICNFTVYSSRCICNSFNKFFNLMCTNVIRYSQNRCGHLKHYVTFYGFFQKFHSWQILPIFL